MPTAARSSRSASRKSTPMVSQNTSLSNTPTPTAAPERTSKSKTKKEQFANLAAEGLNDTERVQALLEVPALAPKVSFREYDLNSTPNSSTMNMQPLGTLPGSKQKVSGSKGKSTAKTASSKSTSKKSGANKESPLSIATGITTAEAAVLSPKSEIGGGAEDGQTEYASTAELQLRLQAVFDVALERSKGLHGGKTSRYLEGVFKRASHDIQMALTVQAVLKETATQEQIDAFNRLFFAVKTEIDSNEPNGEFIEGADENRVMQAGQPTAPQSNASSAAQSPPNGTPSILCDPSGLDLETLPAHVVENHDDRYERAYKSHKAKQPLDTQPSVSAVRSTADQLDTLADQPFIHQDSYSRKRARSSETLDTLESLEISSEVGSMDIPMAGEPAKKKVRQTRTKLSPARAKNSQNLPGVPTEAVTRITRVGSEAVSDNDDFCTVCGAPGKFLCCDRCPGSFHFFCLNPPWTEPVVPEGNWFCAKCTYEQQPHARTERSIFGQLLHNIERKNPVIYSLPKKIKTYFEGVQSGSDGQYLNAGDSKPQKRGHNNEEGDYLKLVEKNGEMIWCFHCRGSAVGGRRLVKCDFCPLYWHLDCTSPPMPVPPNTQRMWKCPAHAETGIVSSQNVLGQLLKGSRANIERAKTLSRKPRVPKIVETSLKRGHKNNGHIEVENSETEAEPEFREHEQDGIIYRLPERGIKLDFLDAVRKKRAQRPPFSTHGSGNGREHGGGETLRLTVSEWEAIQALSSHFTYPKMPEVPAVANIVQELVANAPPDVQSLFRRNNITSESVNSDATSASPALPVSKEASDEDHNQSKPSAQQLKAIIELCQQQLREVAGAEVES